MPVIVNDAQFDPWQTLRDYVNRHHAGGGHGATSVFAGTMRDYNLGDDVLAMQLDHYPGMTEKELEKICSEAAGRWEILDSLVVHRHGLIRPGETIMLVATWSAHRAEAFEACRYIVEALKSRAPFWKKEKLRDSERWLHQQT